MTLPNSQTVTNWYLYGQSQTPSDLVGDNLIRHDEDMSRKEINALDYMKGPGRFALPAMSSLVKAFFEYEWVGPNVIPFVSDKEYTKAEAAALLGLSDYGISFNQYSYDDGSTDYGERIYVWGSTAFKLSDDVRFVVDSNGQRYIKNMAIVPRYHEGNPETTDLNRENFDFESSDLATFLANGILEGKIDPSTGIGRKVIFNIVGVDAIPVSSAHYDLASYQSDLGKEASWYQGGGLINGASIYAAVENVWNNLWGDGTTRFIDNDGRAIIYGTAGTDSLSDKSLSLMALPQMENAARSNGVALIAGSGADTLEGTALGDYLLGGDGNDTLYGGSGDDIIYGDAANPEDALMKGDDNLYGGAGNDKLYGGAGNDKFLNPC